MRTETGAHSGALVTELSRELQERTGQSWQVPGGALPQRGERKPWGRGVGCLGRAGRLVGGTEPGKLETGEVPWPLPPVWGPVGRGRTDNAGRGGDSGWEGVLK